uniref:Eburicol 14 alpha-demethylase n=1 Tax=Ganoderma boninense TaxID=34458 RepID=A0A5K1K2L7_9APHY
MAPFMYCALALALISSALAAPTVSPEEIEKRSDRTGRGTFFEVGLGACGQVNTDSDHIVAIPSSLFDGGMHCEQTVLIENMENGMTAVADVRDSCPGCGADDIDMSPSLFESLGASLDDGVIPITWNFQ